MGLVTGFLNLLADEAARQLYDEDLIMAELTELQYAREAGEIDDEQMSAEVGVLLQRLEDGRRYREWRAMDG